MTRRRGRLNVRAGALAVTLKRDRALALLFRDLATIRTDVPVFESVDELEWHGPTPAFAAVKARFDAAMSDESAGGRPR